MKWDGDSLRNSSAREIRRLESHHFFFPPAVVTVVAVVIQLARYVYLCYFSTFIYLFIHL